MTSRGTSRQHEGNASTLGRFKRKQITDWNRNHREQTKPSQIRGKQSGKQWEMILVHMNRRWPYKKTHKCTHENYLSKCCQLHNLKQAGSVWNSLGSIFPMFRLYWAPRIQPLSRCLHRASVGEWDDSSAAVFLPRRRAEAFNFLVWPRCLGGTYLSWLQKLLVCPPVAPLCSSCQSP